MPELSLPALPETGRCLQLLKVTLFALALPTLSLVVFHTLIAPVWVLASSNVSGGAPSKMECSKCSRGPMSASSKLKTEGTNFNKLCIHIAHGQIHCTFPTACLPNLMSSWKSLQPWATTTRPGFLSSSFCFIKASTTSHPLGASHPLHFGALPTFTELKST